jgi:hypothetical protein
VLSLELLFQCFNAQCAVSNEMNIINIPTRHQLKDTDKQNWNANASDNILKVGPIKVSNLHNHSVMLPISFKVHLPLGHHRFDPPYEFTAEHSIRNQDTGLIYKFAISPNTNRLCPSSDLRALRWSHRSRAKSFDNYDNRPTRINRTTPLWRVLIKKINIVRLETIVSPGGLFD